MRIAIQGEYGSFSHDAALRMEPEAAIIPCSLSAELFELLARQEVSCAVIPIENSLAGSVVEHFDLLFENDVRIEREFLLRIRHNLIGVPGSHIAGIQRVLSHPVALAQCRRFFIEHPQMAATPFYDTAGSVKQILDLGDRSEAAIASSQAALFYGAQILASGIEDNAANFTRFLLVRRTRDLRQDARPNKISIAFTIENSPGTLVSALQVFAAHGINLSKIESRPVQGQPWQYVFYTDFQVSYPEATEAALRQLTAECLLVKELGRYRAAQPID